LVERRSKNLRHRRPIEFRRLRRCCAFKITAPASILQQGNHRLRLPSRIVGYPDIFLISHIEPLT